MQNTRICTMYNIYPYGHHSTCVRDDVCGGSCFICTIACWIYCKLVYTHVQKDGEIERGVYTAPPCRLVILCELGKCIQRIVGFDNSVYNIVYTYHTSNFTVIVFQEYTPRSFGNNSHRLLPSFSKTVYTLCTQLHMCKFYVYMYTEHSTCTYNTAHVVMNVLCADNG